MSFNPFKKIVKLMKSEWCCGNKGFWSTWQQVVSVKWWRYLQGEVGYFYPNFVSIRTFPAGLEDYIYFGLEDYTNLFCYKFNKNKS